MIINTYNTFSWSNVDKEQKDKITKITQSILDAQNLYSKRSLADLYDLLTMPQEC
ncbi:type IIL restriction-modification enzyme MmeI [Limosilactobacillus balticus]|uniref:type IIL restriction-modification enzyme MmeI n=1 Tax=Limosilactobacillus balticus TaxID=2759747 RepID=UPI003994F2D3